MLGSIWWVDLIFGRHVGGRVERVVTPVGYQHSLGQENAEEHSRHTTHYHNAPKTCLKSAKMGQSGKKPKTPGSGRKTIPPSQKRKTRSDTNKLPKKSMKINTNDSAGGTSGRGRGGRGRGGRGRGGKGRGRSG